jgi:hypothetical protein
MTTTTTTLSEEEVRAAIAREWRRDLFPARPSIELEWDAAWGRVGALVDAPWDLDDLRRAEVDSLDSVIREAIDPIRRDTERRVIEAAVAAVLRFAADHPDAPRRRA